jgi:anti-sigma factor RsiW
LPDEGRAIPRAALHDDPDPAEAFGASAAVDDAARAVCAAEADAPVPPALSRAGREVPIERMPAPQRRTPPWLRLAAAVALLAVGRSERVRAGPRARQWRRPPCRWPPCRSGCKTRRPSPRRAAALRHLVEGPAAEAENTVARLADTIGAPFAIPDLGRFGLTLDGAPLVFANAALVALLMYRDAAGAVIAPCLKSAPRGEAPFETREIGGLAMVGRRAGGHAAVVLSGPGTEDLLAAAL